MYTPHSLEIALMMMIATAICWGSWANTFKGVKNYRFELFYWDYAVGIFLISVILAFTMGSTSNDSASFLNNVRLADGSNIIYTLVGGAVFNLANLLLVAAIDMAGLAIAFPVSIGIALVVGVIASYLQQPKGNASLLAIGVACAVIAVILDGKAYGSLAKAAGSASKKSIITCIVSGVLMGLWSPFVAHAMSHGKTLGPYSVSVFLTLGALLSCFIWNIYFMKKPLVGEPVKFGEFFRGPASGHVLGLLGGAIWGTGNRHRWWRLSGECLPGKNFKERSRKPKPIWRLCSFSICWRFCLSPKPIQQRDKFSSNLSRMTRQTRDADAGPE
jgi:glucose uptake protein